MILIKVKTSVHSGGSRVGKKSRHQACEAVFRLGLGLSRGRVCALPAACLDQPASRSRPIYHSFYPHLIMSFARRRGTKAKKGVQFTVMVVGAYWLFNHPHNYLFPYTTRSFLGASGTGRTTFVNTLCESEVLAHKVSDNAETTHVEEGIRIKPVNVGMHYSVTVKYLL